MIFAQLNWAMDIKDLQSQIEEHLKFTLNSLGPRHSFNDVIAYSVMPPGKLFRPLLVAASYFDFHKSELAKNQKLPSNILNLACAIEIHHAYTLVHDDMPCMDDDDYRRGRPSVHKQFGQWQALLAGDSLLGMSYQILGKIESAQINNLITLFGKLTGPQGLILGQVLDLSHEMNESFSKLVTTHFLKTGRLIQLSLLAPWLLSLKNNNSPFFQKSGGKKLLRLGREVGISFQLLDDVLELAENNLKAHEWQVNPWPSHFEFCMKETIRSLNSINQCLDSNTKNISKVLTPFFKKNALLLAQKGEIILKNGKLEGKSFAPLMAALNFT